MTSSADTKRSSSHGTKENQIIPMKQLGIITLGSHLLFSLSDWIFFKSLLCTKKSTLKYDCKVSPKANGNGRARRSLL